MYVDCKHDFGTIQAVIKDSSESVNQQRLPKAGLHFTLTHTSLVPLNQTSCLAAPI